MTQLIQTKTAMTTQPFLITVIAVTLTLTFQISCASVVKPVAEAIEQLSKLAGRAPATGAAEALEIAWRANGKAALEAAKRGGLGLTEAAARHGDDVMKMAVRVPESAAVLAARADKVLPLARKFGDDILRIEAKAPGLADDAARIFPAAGDLRRLVALPEDELRGVISFASHASDSAAARTLLAAVENQGGSVLTKLKPGQILAGGLSTAMVIAASGGAVAVASSPPILPQMFNSILAKIGTPVGIVLAFLVLVIALPLTVRFADFLWRACRRRQNHAPCDTVQPANR